MPCPYRIPVIDEREFKERKLITYNNVLPSALADG
jgi:hypothetical protein